MMKTCPICAARVFEDMSICYNCMHQFEIEPSRPQIPGLASEKLASPTGERVGGSINDNVLVVTSPVSLAAASKEEPSEGASPRWVVRIELLDRAAASEASVSCPRAGQAASAEHELVFPSTRKAL